MGVAKKARTTEVVKVEAVLTTAEPPKIREAEPEQEAPQRKDDVPKDTQDDVPEGETFEIKLDQSGSRQQMLGIEVNHGDSVNLLVERISTNPNSLVQMWNT